MNQNQIWSDRDLKVLWHPCTQMKEHEKHPPIPIRRAQGVWLEDFEGNRYIDAISSWWVNLFGHAHPKMNAALSHQAETLEHVLLAGFTHEPAIRLAEALIQKAPLGLDRCFFADNGSSAVEVALKMSFHYWRNQGALEKKAFVTLTNSYHGETLGALAIGDVGLYREIYAPLLMERYVVESPDEFHRPEDISPEAFARQRFEAMEGLLAREGHKIAAVIIEPLVQCAGGMRMYDKSYLTLLRDACDRHQVHLIADEIAVGFGRTGTFFASEQGPICPDFLCLSKGLTGGYLPLSAVLTTAQVFEAFYAEYHEGRAFLHSHSYTGNPLACRMALASLELFDEEQTLEKNRHLASLMADAVSDLKTHPHVAEVRQKGMILALEMALDGPSRTPYPTHERRGQKAYREALRHGALLRPLGDVLYFMPPYVIKPSEIEQMAHAARMAIQHATS